MSYLQVEVAQQTLPELREQAAAAAAKLQPAQVQERQLGQSFAQQAPRLLQVAQAVVQPVRYQILLLLFYFEQPKNGRLILFFRFL